MAAKKAATKKQAESDVTRFELDGQTLEFDIDTLTFGEVEFIEEYFGKSFDAIDAWDSGRGTLVLAYLALKRKNPTTDIDDVRDMQLNLLKSVDEGDADPPTDQ